MTRPHPHGATHGPVVLTDTAANSRVVIAPARGAIVTSFCVAGRELMYFDQATFDDPEKNVRGGIPILFPSPGKLEGDSWRDDEGRQHSMRQHGFARNLPWMVEAVGQSNASFLLMSDESTLAGYPSHFNAVFHVALEGTHLRLGMQIHNTGNRPMRFGLGYHPYFRVDNKRGVRIETDATRAFNNVTRKIEPFSGFDFTQPEVDLHLMDQTQTASRMTFDDGSAILVSGSEEFTYWVVWSVAGKPYICLEPWTCPGNALNTGERLIELASGESRHCWVDIGYEKNGAAQREL